MNAAGVANRREGQQGNSPSQRPFQGAEPAFRCSPDSFATIPVSIGWMPDLMLARLAIVPENGHADHGTGHTPAINNGRFQLSRSPIWTKFRGETRVSILLAKASGFSIAEVQMESEGGFDMDNKALCT